MPAGARILPYRSNIPRISEFAFEMVDPSYAGRALQQKMHGGHAILAGGNYGQGSSREHAALAPRYLGLRLVLAKGFARIHRTNLVNYGILPVILDEASIYDQLEPGDVVAMEHVAEQLLDSGKDHGLELSVPRKGLAFTVTHTLFPRMVEIILAGGRTNWIRTKKQ